MNPITIGTPMGMPISTLIPGPIPWSVIDRYAKRFGYQDDEYAMLLTLITAMDRECLKIAAGLRAEQQTS